MLDIILSSFAAKAYKTYNRPFELNILGIRSKQYQAQQL